MPVLGSPPIHSRSPTTQRYFLDELSGSPKLAMYDYPSGCATPTVSSAPSSRSPSPEFARSIPDQLSYSSSTLSSLSIDTADDDTEDPDYDGDEIILPSYNIGQPDPKDQTATDSNKSSLDLSTDRPRWKSQAPASDDSSLEPEPSRHVDYLSHEWKEEEGIWNSWRYITTHKDSYSNGVRLENASWRTWAKSRRSLGTVTPEALNWLKDCDVTWLYGPLITHRPHDETPVNSNISPPSSQLETPGASSGRKPILKKKTASEVMLQRSLSQHTLLQHAGAILRAQEARNGECRGHLSNPADCGRMGDQGTVTSTDDSSLSTPPGTSSPNERRHIHFNNEVSQCIAVEGKEGDEEQNTWPVTFDDDTWTQDSIAIEPVYPEAPDAGSPTRSSCSENKTIALLPSTTLKYRGDTPPPTGSLLNRWYNSYSTSSLSRTPSVETLRPSSPPRYEDDKPSGEGNLQSKRHKSAARVIDSDDELELDQDLTSGDVMSYEEGEWSDTGMLDKMIDAVNTARDIAHVIWNVGWRR